MMDITRGTETSVGRYGEEETTTSSPNDSMIQQRTAWPTTSMTPPQRHSAIKAGCDNGVLEDPYVADL